MGFNYNVLRINQRVHTACNLNYFVKGEGLLKVTNSHVHGHCKSGNISETVLDRDNNRPLRECYKSEMAYLLAAIVMTLSVLEGHSILQAFSCAIFGISGPSRGPSASAELLVYSMNDVISVL